MFCIGIFLKNEDCDRGIILYVELSYIWVTMVFKTKKFLET